MRRKCDKMRRKCDSSMRLVRRFRRGGLDWGANHDTYEHIAPVASLRFLGKEPKPRE